MTGEKTQVSAGCICTPHPYGTSSGEDCPMHGLQDETGVTAPDPARLHQSSRQLEEDGGHRWSAWRTVGVAFAYDGTEVGHSIIEVNGDPITPGWTRRCACGEVESR